MIERTYKRADRCLADVEVYLLRLSETKVLSEEETKERDSIWNKLAFAESVFRDCRKEHCIRCDKFELAREGMYGVCNGCRWEK